MGALFLIRSRALEGTPMKAYKIKERKIFMSRLLGSNAFDVFLLADNNGFTVIHN